MSGLGGHITEVVAADATHCIIMIREGRITVEAARHALETTLMACDQGVADIRGILRDVEFDINTNNWVLQQLDDDRRETSFRQAEAQANAARARAAKHPMEAQQYQMLADGYGLRLERVLEGIRNGEREGERLAAARAQTKENLAQAEWERARLALEGGAEYQRLAERAASENSLLQRMADLIAGKR